MSLREIEDWETIHAFPQYEVSTLGRVRRIKTDRILSTKENQQGILGVGLMKNGEQHHRTIAILVAQAFVPKPNAAFDTPINLDGDRSNNAADNLMWRPRWHAVAYVKQFSEPYHSPITRPIRDRQSLVVYENSWHVAMANGLLEADVVLSIMNHTYAGITFQQFEVLA